MLTALVGTGKKVAFIESKLTLLVIQKQLHSYVIDLVLYLIFQTYHTLIQFTIFQCNNVVYGPLKFTV